MTTKQAVRVATKTGGISGTGIDLALFAIMVSGPNGNQQELHPVGIAREAEHAETAKGELRQKEVRFGDHLLTMAAKCKDLSEFDSVIKETMRQLEWGRGREKATPRTFSAYVSLVRGGMKKGLKPLGTADVPVIKQGQLQRGEDGEIVTEKLKLDGVSVFRRATQNLAIAKREANKAADDDRRSAGRREAARLHTAGFITAEAEQAVSRFLWAMQHQRDEKRQAAMVEGLDKLTAKYPPPEPFPEKRAQAAKAH
jgi:hypothetical protein